MSHSNLERNQIFQGRLSSGGNVGGKYRKGCCAIEIFFPDITASNSIQFVYMKAGRVIIAGLIM